MKINLFGKTKLLLATEYAMIVADVCQQRGIPITAQLVDKLEEMILGEFPTKSAQTLAMDMIPNVLSIFETDASPVKE